jgi:hypothetical protein
MPVVLGNLKLEIDVLGLEARITIVPDNDGAEISPERVKSLLADRGVKEGVDQEEIVRAFWTLARKRAAVAFIAARGAVPVAAEPEKIVLEPLEIPKNLEEEARRFLSLAPPPEVFRERETRAKKERKTLKKKAFPFLHAKEETETVWEKLIVREKVDVDPTVSEKGYVRAGALVGRMRKAVLGKDGRSIYGRILAAPRIEKGDFHIGGHLTQAGAEIRAEVSGFLRKGVNWCDVVPYQDNDLSVMVDGTTCLISFAPGERGASIPSARSVIEEAAKLGFAKESLLPEARIAEMIRDAVASRKPIDKQPIIPAEDAVISVTVSPDKLRATLTLRKGTGAGRPLSLAEVSDAIRKSGIRGFNAELIKKDILGFYNGRQRELKDYTLVVGQAPERGTDGKLEWLAALLKKEDADRIREATLANVSRLGDISSLNEFPLESVESIGFVQEDTEILTIVPPGQGKPGLDVLKAGIPGIRGAEPQVKLFENVRRKKDTVVAALDGIVEKGTRNGVLLVRIRPHRDAELRVFISPDRMQGFVSYSPSQGTGRSIGAEEVKAKIESEGVLQGVKSDALLEALEAISKNLPVGNLLIAEGKATRGSSDRKAVFQVQMASGRKVAFRQDGSADFKNQDTITQVAKGDLIATIPPPGQGSEDGWDVTGKSISPLHREEAAVQAGRNVRSVEEKDGAIRFYAEADGELSSDRGFLEVKELHTVGGDVSLATGNVKFMGKVHVQGSVLSGFTVVAGDDLVIDEVIEAAFVSSDGSIVVGQGVKGEGRGILRARREIRASFAEQANLLSVGDIRIRSGCLRCQIKCNGKLLLESEKGNFMGGKAKAKLGASVQNLGSPSGARTELSFGQDYVVKDQIDKEEKEVQILKSRIAEADARMRALEKAVTGDRQALEAARAEKLRGLKELEKRSLRLLGLRDKFEEHFPSTVVVRGTMYPGAVVESHGRYFQVKTEKTRISLHFDAALGRILEQPAK